MKKILLLFSLIICTAHINGMKRSHNWIIDRPSKKPRPDHKVKQHTEKPSLFLSLPPELQNIIFEFMTTKITASKQKEATQPVRALSFVNKFYNVKINDLSFSDALIDTFSRRFFCAHETIARSLATRAACDRFHIQRPLKELCLSDEKITANTFHDVVDIKKVNLEFTYTHKSEPKTALMISIDYANNMYDRLLENGAQVNSCNTQGWSALSLAAKSSYTYNSNRRGHFYKLVQRPDINLNQQNILGKSPLYLLLFYIHRCRYYVSGNDVAMVRALLQAGADPELPDTSKRKITPLRLADRIHNGTIIELLKNAIADKHIDLMAIDT